MSQKIALANALSAALLPRCTECEKSLENQRNVPLASSVSGYFYINLPSTLNKGHLTKAWDGFRDLFGGFYVEPPLSPAMTGFLHARQSSQSEDLCVVQPLGGEPNAHAACWRAYLTEVLKHPRFAPVESPAPRGLP
jgi:hypothetical protein